jgi:hypothetical protein
MMVEDSVGNHHKKLNNNKLQHYHIKLKIYVSGQYHGMHNRDWWNNDDKRFGF